MPKIITNHVPRDLMSAHEISDDVRKEHFDYISEGDWYEDSHYRFFKYKGEWYDIQEFTPIQDTTLAKDWDGVQHDTFFSATLIKYVNDLEQVICGRVYS